MGVLGFGSLTSFIGSILVLPTLVMVPSDCSIVAIREFIAISLPIMKLASPSLSVTGAVTMLFNSIVLI